ncbi:MAG: hypothetical protein U0235_30030 [Polyangiaceae bacterium]
MNEPLKKTDDEGTDIQAPRTSGAGRVGVYTALGALSGVVALPWLPDTIQKRVRGALAQDLSSRFGVTLTPEARAVLAAPESELFGGALGSAVRFIALRWLKRFSPLGFLPPVRAGVTTYALGHLLERYLVRHRQGGTTRMDADEAKKLRALVDQALLEVLRTDLKVPTEANRAGTEDLRDGVTQVIDGVVITVASLPDWITRRLDAAFDAVVKREGA